MYTPIDCPAVVFDVHSAWLAVVAAKSVALCGEAVAVVASSTHPTVMSAGARTQPVITWYWLTPPGPMTGMLFTPMSIDSARIVRTAWVAVPYALKKKLDCAPPLIAGVNASTLVALGNVAVLWRHHETPHSISTLGTWPLTGIVIDTDLAQHP